MIRNTYKKEAPRPGSGEGLSGGVNAPDQAAFSSSSSPAPVLEIGMW